MISQLYKYFLALFALFAVLSSLAAQQPKALELYLLIGQSNMAGRGQVEDQDLKEHSRVWTLDKQNQWVLAVDPIHFDKKQAGVGPGRTFGIRMAEHTRSANIGLIPCAVGGTSIRKWQPGSEDKKTQTHPYDDMLARLRIAKQSGTIKGVLWHQGEADAKMGERGTYEPALVELIELVRAECGDQMVPFVIGQLGQFEGKPWSAGRVKVDQAHQTVVEKLRCIGFVTSDGLMDRGDLVHFNAASARLLGERFAIQMIELQSE